MIRDTRQPHPPDEEKLTPLQQFQDEFAVILSRVNSGQTTETNLTGDMNITGFREELVDIWLGFRAIIVHLRTTPKDQLDFNKLIEQIDSLVKDAKNIQQKYYELYRQGKDFAGRIESINFLSWTLNKLTPFRATFNAARTGRTDLETIGQYIDEDLSELKTTLGPDLFK